jgi:2-methylcitrate dehydratase PrpD
MDHHRKEIQHPIAVDLAGYVAKLRYEDLPDDIVAMTKTLVLDQLACQLIGSTMPWVEPALRLAKMSEGAKAEGTIVKSGARVLASDAAFANATFGQACELDDSCSGSAGHIGTASIPVAVAIGERECASGRDLITAIVAGYEVMYRIMQSVHPHHNDRGFHSQSIGGPFAGAAAAGKLLGLDQERLAHALAIAGSHASGSLEYDQSGGEVKRVHAGIGARGGVYSALLAEMGLTGPKTIIEGKRGFCSIFATKSDASRVLADLGKDFAIRNVRFKLHPSVGSHHSVIDATRRIVAENRIDPKDIASIRIGTSHASMLHGAGIRYPQDVIGAQFSMAFSTALAATRPSNELGDYMNPAMWTDPEILRLIGLVENYPHPEANGKLQAMAVVEIQTADGRTFGTREEYPRGTAKNPASEEDLSGKARRLAGTVLDAPGTDALVATVGELEKVGNVSELTARLVRR